MEQLDLRIFDLSPIPMWIQDYSGVKKIFDQWASDGIVDLKAYLLEQPDRLLPCIATIKTLKINRSTLRLYEAENLEEILSSFAKFHFKNITIPQIIFFAGLWEEIPNCVFAPINYTCTGKQIDVQLKANIIPGYEQTWGKILLTTEDISPYQNARRFAESLFTYSPTSLWIKDFSKIKQHFTLLRQNNISDLKQYLLEHPDFLQLCFNEIHFIDINQSALRLFKAKCKSEFLNNIDEIFSIHIQQTFSDKLIKLWEGDYAQQHECTYFTVDGQKIHVLEQFNIFPHNEEDWCVIQVALTDITERKFLENHLEYLGKHDTLTNLYNRTFYNEEIIRIEQNSIFPVSCIYLDMNGLKTINDNFGHDIGDQLLKRCGQILINSIQDTHYSAARIGGDEFVILMPNAGQNSVQRMLKRLNDYILQDNQQHNDLRLSVAAGYSTTQQNERLENSIKRADRMMYQSKHKYYALNTEHAN